MGLVHPVQDNELVGSLEGFAEELVFSSHASVLRYMSTAGNRLTGSVPAELSKIAAFTSGPWCALLHPLRTWSCPGAWCELSLSLAYYLCRLDLHATMVV